MIQFFNIVGSVVKVRNQEPIKARSYKTFTFNPPIFDIVLGTFL